MASNGVWAPQTVVNAVKEAVERLSKNGEVPVKETDVVSYVESILPGASVGRTDVVKALITLEAFGVVRVVSSGWKERIILYKTR